MDTYQASKKAQEEARQILAAHEEALLAAQQAATSLEAGDDVVEDFARKLPLLRRNIEQARAHLGRLSLGCDVARLEALVRLKASAVKPSPSEG
ncbi:hypothetical protein E3E12_05835 [Formicincola oecophyllae]|uniref:Uncharacterized protein n=1 Tax=Formicincola oecophyllae TaxID=2558361 RepID=A0A4Y6U9A5_9PROT|nr:hypothetical protein [Formicincola oecophyllae]QDH13784.1 hypothetical protein E3E12_05835 [Formicincola oecophyllae]